MGQQQKMNTIVMIIVITMVTRYGGVTAQSSDCLSMLVIMSPCLSYVAGNASTASSGCCTQLASVIQLQPQCLCQGFNGTGSFMGININQIQASELPKVCKVHTPSQCNASNSPTNTPPSSGPNTTVPPADNRPSDATSTRFTSIHILFLLHVSAYAIVF